MGLEAGQHPYHLPCPPAPPAHLHYFYDPSCFVRVAPPHDVVVAQAKNSPMPSKTETQSEYNVAETSSLLHDGAATTKREISLHSSETESGSETADPDMTGEIGHRTEITTKSEKISADGVVSTRETHTVLATVPKTEAVPTESVSATGKVVIKSNNVAEAAVTKQSRCKLRRSAAESTAQCTTDRTEATTKEGHPKTTAALGGLEALYVAAVQLRSETTTKTVAHTETPLDGLQLLCSAMERAQKDPGNGTSRSKAKSTSPAPCVATTGSPDLEKNYNAPKKGSFTPLKTSLLKKDETGEWCSSPLKIGEQAYNVDWF